MGGVLFADVINAGAKVGTGLGDENASILGLIKNHWTFRAHLDFGEEGEEGIGQVQFGMDVVHANNIGSNEGQYARSSHSDPLSCSKYSYSPISSIANPPALDTDDGAQATLPLTPA